MSGKSENTQRSTTGCTAATKTARMAAATPTRKDGGIERLLLSAGLNAQAQRIEAVAL